jgi:hypothetical protein
MKKHWTLADYRLMENSTLEFTDRDIQFIQEGFGYRPQPQSKQ